MRRRSAIPRGLMFGLLWLLAALPAAALEREAFTFVHYTLNVTITPAGQDLEVAGTIELRNDSAAPQKQVSLQISSSLAWKKILVAEHGPVEYISQSYTSDIDHTGALTEAVLNLPQAVPPKGTLKLEVAYGGAIHRDGARLLRMGAPERLALANDWDQIGETSGAVRGLGYVAWYPVALEAVSLSDGNAGFAAMEQWKQRHRQSVLDVKLSLAGPATAGRRLSLVTSAGPAASKAEPVEDSEFSSSRGAALTASSVRVSFPLDGTPIFSYGEFFPLENPAIRILHSSEHASDARNFAASAEKAERVLTNWFGPLRQRPLLIELADQQAFPFLSGTVLVAPLRVLSPDEREMLMTRALVHGSIHSPRRWIDSGLERFAQALVREQQAGRAGAQRFLGQVMPALVAAEANAQKPAADEKAATQRAERDSLINTQDELLSTGKAGFVWWMLRDLVGDSALTKALAAYRPEQDRDPSYLQKLLEAQLPAGKSLDTATNRSSLGTPLQPFFESWVYRDLGLPDFSLESAYARETLKNNYVVSVTVENLSPVWAEVPIIIRLSDGQTRQTRLQVPGRQKAVTRMTVQGMPESAEVNDGSVPESDTSNNQQAIQKAGR